MTIDVQDRERSSLRAGLVALVVFVGLLAAPVAGTAQILAQASAPHAAVTVEGNRRIEADTIRSYFRADAAGHVDATAADAALKALFDTGLFQDVRIRRADGRLIVTVVENPVISRVAFEGNKSVKEDQLKTEVQSKAGGPLSRALVQADTVRVTELLRRSGRFNAHVEPKIIDLPNGRVDLVFEINEAERTGIKEIVFVGNKAFSSLRLKQVIKSGVTNLLSSFLMNDLYDPDRIEVDRGQLRRFYLTHGYPDVRVVAAAASYDPERKGFVVTFTIDEGALYRVGAVDVQSSIDGVDPAAMRAKVRTAAGDIFNTEAADKSVEDLSIELAKRGHPFAVVRPRVERQGDTITLIYRIEEGARVYVEQINIRGNVKTLDHVIRREFDLAEGDAYNRALVDRAERRLKNLGYFKTVKITTEPGSASDRVILNVEVEEQSTGEFSVAGGYGSADGWIGEVSIGERNLLGTGYYVKASVRYGEYSKGVELSVTEPYLMGSRMSLGGNIFYRQTVSNATYQSYGSESYGAGLTLGVPLTEEVGAQFRYSLSRQRVSLDPALMDCSPSNPPPGCYGNGEASVPVKQAVLNGPAWVSAVGYTLTYSTLDNIRNPTSGMRSDFKQDLAGVGGDVRFLRSTEDFRYYHEIVGDTVGMVRLQGGTISGWDGQSVPLQNSFFGGPDLVRGFEVNGFGPRDLTPGTTLDNVGGTKYWATSAELRTPVPWLPPEFGLKLAAFADAGSVWGYSGGVSPALAQSLNVSDTKTVRSSVGAGLIWDSPFGPLRVDYAYPTSKATYDVTKRFRFSAWGF